MVMPNTTSPAPQILTIQTCGVPTPTVTIDGDNTAPFDVDGKQVLSMSELTVWFGTSKSQIRGWIQTGVLTAAGSRVRLLSHGATDGVPLHAVSRFLRTLAESSPLAPGMVIPALRVPDVIFGPGNIPLIVNGIPQCRMSDETYSRLIGEP